MSVPHVLVVDPNPATLRRVEESLVDVGFRFLSARDATEAHDRSEGADIALVLAAASLPRGNGYDLARALRDRHPAATILLMTGGFEVFNRVRADEAGVAGHLTKPFSPARLRSRVEELIGPLDTLAATARPAPVEQAPADPPAKPAPRAPVSEDGWQEPAPPARPFHALRSEERIASILPRDYKELPLVRVDPAIVGPEIERAILEVLPEVVEVVLRKTLETSPAFRDLVARTVHEAVRTRASEIAAELTAAAQLKTAAELTATAERPAPAAAPLDPATPKGTGDAGIADA